MSVTYNYKRFRFPYSDEYESVERAIWRVHTDLEDGEAWPVSITRDGEELWTAGDWDDVRDRLDAFAAEHGVVLPEDF